jgi:hypothetical protein
VRTPDSSLAETLSARLRHMSPTLARKAAPSSSSRLLRRSIRPLFRESNASQLESTVETGNYDWKLRFTLETGLSGNRW